MPTSPWKKLALLTGFLSDTGQADADDLVTAETDTAKRLAPDGTGGVAWGTAGTGGTITVVEEGDTPITDVDTVVFDGATVTDDTGGQVTVTVTAGGAPDDADYLVGTAHGDLSAEIVVGTTPGGELGGTWGSPTVDATHSGSTHSAATDAHIADGSDAHDASAVSFTPAAGIAATDVQAAIVEDAGDLAAHLADTADAHDASAVSIVDAGTFFTGTDVEAALQELGAGVTFSGDAGDIPFTPAGSIAATDVQAAIEEVAAEAGGGPAVWMQHIGSFIGAAVATNFATISQDTSSILGWLRVSSGAQNAEVGWDVILSAGTWSVLFYHAKANDRGIYTVRFDGVDKGTVDGYNATLTRNNLGSVTGISVPTTALVRVTLKMATKNASSSSYVGSFSDMALVRTA